MFQKTNKVKKDQRVQKESFFYNLIVILGHALKSRLKKIEMLKQEE